MIALQAETQSPLGRSMRDAIVAVLDEALAGDEHELSADERASLADARDRLAAWTLETPHGVAETDRAVVAASVATTIFNAALTRIAPLALGDEMGRAGLQAPTTGTARLLEWMLTTPERLQSYDATAGDSVLWDDLRTEALETRTTIVVRAVLAGLAFLDERLGRERDEWRWGRLHTVRFTTVVPVLGARDPLSIPPSESAEHPDGFPRHGDWGCVDPGNFRGGLWGTEDFSFGSGASQRLVVEMRPEGPRAWNALPGGQSIDPASPHKSDEAEAWVRNEQPPLHFERDDVETHAVRRLHLEPLAP